MDSVQVCEPASASVIQGILVEFVGMDWSPAHTPFTEEIFAGLQSPLVLSSSKSSSSLLVQPSSKLPSSPMLKPSYKSSSLSLNQTSTMSLLSSSTKSPSSRIVSPSLPLPPPLPKPFSSSASPPLSPPRLRLGLWIPHLRCLPPGSSFGGFTQLLGSACGSLSSTMFCHPSGYAGVPRPSASTLVNCCCSSD